MNCIHTKPMIILLHEWQLRSVIYQAKTQTTHPQDTKLGIFLLCERQLRSVSYQTKPQTTHIQHTKFSVFQLYEWRLGQLVIRSKHKLHIYGTPNVVFSCSVSNS